MRKQEAPKIYLAPGQSEEYMTLHIHRNKRDIPGQDGRTMGLCRFECEAKGRHQVLEQRGKREVTPQEQFRQAHPGVDLDGGGS